MHYFMMNYLQPKVTDFAGYNSAIYMVSKNKSLTAVNVLMVQANLFLQTNGCDIRVIGDRGDLSFQMAPTS